MEIRIEQIDADPPVWKVFLGTFFIVCESAEEAVACQEAARQYVASHPGVQCFLPHPPVISRPAAPRTALGRDSPSVEVPALPEGVGVDRH